MKSVDINQFELLENRVSELEKIFTFYSIQLKENNEVLANILLSINSALENCTTNEQKNQIKQ